MSSDHLVAIEGRLWTSDPAFYRDTLLEDAVLVFADRGAVTRDVAVADVERRVRERRHWSIVEFDRLQCLAPTDDSALLTYTAIARPSGSNAVTRAHCTSLYLKREGQWRLAFHQQTPQAEATERLQASLRAITGADGERSQEGRALATGY